MEQLAEKIEILSIKLKEYFENLNSKEKAALTSSNISKSSQGSKFNPALTLKPNAFKFNLVSNREIKKATRFLKKEDTSNTSNSEKPFYLYMKDNKLEEIEKAILNERNESNKLLNLALKPMLDTPYGNVHPFKFN